MKLSSQIVKRVLQINESHSHKFLPLYDEMDRMGLSLYHQERQHLHSIQTDILKRIIHPSRSQVERLHFQVLQQMDESQLSNVAVNL